MEKQHAVEFIQKTDGEIISLLKAGTLKGWEHLYNKYAALMYGTIMQAVGFDKVIANELLIKSFTELKIHAFFSGTIPSSLSLCLVQYCGRVVRAFQQFPNVDAPNSSILAESYPVLQATVAHGLPLKTIAAKLGLTEAMAMQHLRAELKQSRGKSTVSEHLNAHNSFQNNAEIYPERD